MSLVSVNIMISMLHDSVQALMASLLLISLMPWQLYVASRRVVCALIVGVYFFNFVSVRSSIAPKSPGSVASRLEPPMGLDPRLWPRRRSPLQHGTFVSFQPVCDYGCD